MWKGFQVVTGFGAPQPEQRDQLKPSPTAWLAGVEYKLHVWAWAPGARAPPTQGVHIRLYGRSQYLQLVKQ